MIRKTIIELFLASGTPFSLDKVAERLGISHAELMSRLETEPKVNNIDAISIKQAQQLVSFYGRNVVFADYIVEAVEKYLAGRSKIEAFEKKARDAGKPPPEDDPLS